MISWVLWAMVNAEAAPDQSWPSARMDQSLPGGQASASEASMRVVESAPPSQGPRPLTVFTGPQTMVVDFAPPDQRVPAAVLGPPVTVVAGAQTVVVRQPAASTWVPRAESPVTVVAGPQTVVMQPSRMDHVLPHSSG